MSNVKQVPASKRPVKLAPNRREFAETARSVHVVTPEAGTSYEDVLKPEFWVHVARFFKPYDHIELRAEDGSYWALLLVRSCSTAGALVSELLFCQLESAEIAVDSPFEVKWSGPHTKFRVMRKSDNHVMRDGFATQEEAHRWLAENIKSMAV